MTWFDVRPISLAIAAALTATPPASAPNMGAPDAHLIAPTRSGIAGSRLPRSVTTFMTAGDTAIGDRGAGCVYVRGGINGPGSVRDATGAWWQLPAGRPMDVACFGAHLDSVSDDSASVQAAIAAATLSGAGGAVTIPGGTIRLCGVRVPNNIRISGAGINATTVFAAKADCTVFNADFPVNGGNVTIEKLSIYGHDGGDQTGGQFVAFRNCTNCRLTDFLLSGAAIGVDISGGNTVNVSIDHGASIGASLYHIAVGGGSDTHIDTVVTAAGDRPQARCGLRITQTGGIWISNVDFTASNSGTCLQPGNGQAVKWIFASNSALGDSGTGAGLLINPTGTGRIDGLSISASWTSANKLGGVVAQCDALEGRTGTIQGVTLTGHRSISNSRDGMFFGCGDGIQVIAPTVVGNSNPKGGGTAGVSSGIVFAAGVSHFSVVGGEYRAIFGDPAYQRFSILVQPGTSDYYTIRDADGVGGTTTGITVKDGGTGTHKTVISNF